MKILLITHTGPPSIDGGSKVILKLGSCLEKRKHQTLLLTTNLFSTDDFTHKNINFRKSGLPVYTVFHRPLKFLSRFFPIFGVFAKGPIFRPIPFLIFLKKVFYFKPDLIIAGPLPTTIVIYGRLIRFLTHSRLLICPSFHPTDPDFQNPLLLETLAKADYLWILTNFEKRLFSKYLSIPSSKMLTLGAGIDFKFLKTNHKNNLIFQKLLYVGSFSQHKNLKTIIAAHQLLLKKYPQLTLVLAGQKTLYFSKLKNLLSLPNIVTIFNFKNKNLSKIIDSSTLLISASTQESFGLILIEAMARGIPVIAANIPVSTEIVKKSRAGLTFLSKNPRNLAAKINYLFENPKLYRHFRDNGPPFVKKNYTWDKITQRLCQKVF